MRNRQPTYPGRVKLIPVDGEANTFDLIRADEPTDPGTPLNKNTLLTDQTAAIMGLGPEATPNDMFAQMQFISNTYVWHKIASEIVYTISETEEQTNLEMYVFNEPNNTEDFTYTGRSFGTGYVLNKDGTITLTGVFTPSKTPIYNNLSYWESILPVYMKVDNELFKITRHQSGGGNFMYYAAIQYIVESKEAGEDFGYVVNADPNAYPPDIDDGISYESMGRLGSLLSKAKAVYGTYTGDGASSKTISFAGKPLFVSIKSSSHGMAYVLHIGESAGHPTTSASDQSKVNLIWGDTSLKLSAANSEYVYYFNYSGGKFPYFAIIE